MVDLSQLEKIKTESEIDREFQITAAINYLNSTAWHVIKNLETGKPIPEDIKKARKDAYAVIDS